jgi:hypothetical protein
MTKFKIEICGDIKMAGSDNAKLERLTNVEFDNEESANKAVGELAADWARPQGIWDIVAVIIA